MDAGVEFLSDKAVLYTWQQLISRAGAEGSEIPFFYGLSTQWEQESLGVIVVPAALDSWRWLLEVPEDRVVWCSSRELLPPGKSLPIGDTLPVLFWGRGYEDGHKPFAERLPNGSIVFYADIIATTFFMLSRWEETVSPVRDQHGRFPAIASVAYKLGFLDRPIVDEYALVLREWLKVLMPRWQPKPRQFTVKLTHDVDLIHRFPTLKTGLKTLGGDLLKRRSLKQSFHTLREILGRELAYVEGIYRLTALSRRYGFGDDAFYFMADGPGPFGCGYDPRSPLIRRCIDDLQSQGFEIGIHPSYDTFLEPQRLAEEKSRLDAILGETQYGGRQHYLRFHAPDTWRHWEQVGLVYDSTIGYADYEGFRCGTCHPFKPFDIEQDRELDLREYPLIVMDGTLKGYRKLSPQAGKERILTLAQRCKQVSGTFTLLWHNSSLIGAWSSWADVYEQVLAELARLG